MSNFAVLAPGDLSDPPSKPHIATGHTLAIRAPDEGYPKVSEDFTIMEKAPTRAFSWLKVPTSTLTFKTLLRHYAKGME